MQVGLRSLCLDGIEEQFHSCTPPAVKGGGHECCVVHRLPCMILKDKWSMSCVCLAQALRTHSVFGQVSNGSILTAPMAVAQVDDAATNGKEQPPVSEVELKEAWLASCRTLYEVQPLPLTCVLVLGCKAGKELLACRLVCLQKDA